jgi:protein tyrosine/serine phosphatase
MRSSRKSLRLFTAGLLLSGVLAVPPAIAAETTSPASAALSAIRIDNFGKINDQYYRGAQPKGADFPALSALGVKLMIDLAAEGDRAEEANARAAGMRFVRIPMTTHQVPSPAVVAQFLSLVSDPANQPVYVHCIGGKHRTGVMTAIYRMTMDRWNAVRALAEMKQYRFGATFLHPEFKAFVDEYVVPAAAASTR